ncbi:ABC transporter substrate-binding protein [Bacillus sp. DNRA2]|uniref:ABC transporter substrate-binding protein n=1 Tax=Bacillus sp. DNRA2 TaxID=2723053 RepID=UPI00145CA847|nr:ABC transporter substrate-binding protein [Bacillus sp. DNRA2]NMD70940.1 ABC transporter substrate-binding protein [Bacillus sp. DNRA2]
MRIAKKLAPIVLLTALAGGILSGCSSEKTAAGSDSKTKQEDKVLQYSGAAGSVEIAELAEDLGYLGDIKLENAGSSSGGPEDIQLTATKQIDFGNAFNGAVIKSVSEGVKIKSVIGSYGVDEVTKGGLFVLEDSPIKTAKDLIGKKVGVNTLGAQAEFFNVQYLRDKGLTEKEIDKVQLVVIPTANAEQILRSGQNDAVRLSELAKDLALEKGGIREITNDLDIYGGPFTAGSYFFADDYIKENPNTVKTFVEGVAKAHEWAKTTPREEVIQRLEKIVKGRNNNEPTANLKYWKSFGVASKGGVIQPKEYTVWVDYLVNDKQLKKGQVKLEELYTNKFNSFAK